MRDSKCKPKFELRICGDWLTVIGVSDQDFDKLINQKPNDEDSAEYNEYRLTFETADDLLAAYHAYRGPRLEVNIAVHVKSEELGVDVFATTADGWGSKGPYALVDLNETIHHSQLAGHIKAAHDILAEVM